VEVIPPGNVGHWAGIAKVRPNATQIGTSNYLQPLGRALWAPTHVMRLFRTIPEGFPKRVRLEALNASLVSQVLQLLLRHTVGNNHLKTSARRL
jgi:hypothetical protein